MAQRGMGYEIRKKERRAESEKPCRGFSSAACRNKYYERKEKDGFKFSFE
jgi:hypothetical protein